MRLALMQSAPMQVQPINKAKTMALNPTLIGIVNGVRFYEHPIYGDESTLIASKGDMFGISDFWELPDITEV